jgi:DNA-binding HxlR family transcriptional regulator
MSAKRTYDDPCGVARALDLVGERWALLVVRELLLGPKRFTDLRIGLPAASQNVLTHRLRELEQSGVVQRRKLGPPAGTWVYELTEIGYDLEPVVLSLARWGSRLPMTAGTELSVDALILALKTAYDPAADPELRAAFGLQLGEDLFHAEVSGGRVTLARGRATSPDATIETSAAAFRSLVFGGHRLADTDAKVGGDNELMARFLALFPRPKPARSPS